MLTLIRFEIKKDEKILYNCEFANPEKSMRSRALTTILIGENGSGKSYLLSQIADFLRYIRKTITKEKKPHYKYNNVLLEYSIEGRTILISKNQNTIKTYINDIEIDPTLITLPSKVIAMSFMVNDKFSFSKFDEDYFYDYRGIRATSNATYTSTIKRIIANAIVKSLSVPYKVESIKTALEFLGMDNRIDITYELKRKTLFKRPVPQKRIKDISLKILEQKRYVNESGLLSISNNPEIISDDINVVEMASSVLREKVNITVDLTSVDKTKESTFDSLDRLEDIGFISNPDIQFYKSKSFSFEETSSGEKNIILTVLNLISSIKENSLILIDEPEISLHPTWQMKYIDFIKKSIASTPGCHLILASHSHFMVSDLEPESSSLVSIRNENHQRLCEQIEYSTYAWSVENILYKVFHLRTTRNNQVEMDLYELTSIISNRSDNHNRAKQIVSNLEKIILDDNDPLNILINQAKHYLGV